MNYRIVIQILGLILTFLGLAMLVPLPFSFYYNSGDHLGIIYSSIITVSVGLSAFLSMRRKSLDAKLDIRPKEGFAIVGLAWILMSAFGSLPFMLSGAIPNFTDAYFETMSGFTTTGASTLTDVEAVSKGIIFWRSFTHWLGGMGIIVLSIAILPFLGVAGMQLFKAEVPGPTADKLTPRITETAKILWGVYLLLTALQTVLLIFGGMNLFDSLCHTFGTIATGGFSIKNTSVAYYHSPFIEYVIIIFMVLSGMSFSMHYNLLRGHAKSFFKNEESRFFILIILVSSLIITFDVFNLKIANLVDSFRHSLFQVSSVITTTGYGTSDYEQWSISSQIILLLLMYIGGGAGSTAGGMKVVRVQLLIKFAYSEIKRLIHPKAVIPVRINGNPVDKTIMTHISVFFVVYIMIATTSVLIITFFGIDFLTAFGAVAATLNNVGPGVGKVGPTDSFFHLPALVKWLLSFLMLLGRLEIFTVLVLFTPTFWRK